MGRELRFKNFEQVRAELDRLGTGLVETTGNWSYFQIIDHMAKAVEISLTGVQREMPFWKKRILGPFLYRLFAFRGYMPAGIKGRSPDRVEGNEAEAVARLRRALDAFEAYEGPFSDHHVLGPFTKKQWRIFHSMHFANHASHAKPKDQ